MKNLFILMLITFIPLCGEEHPFEKADEITYDWLTTAADDTGGCCYVVCLKEIFNKIKVKSLLEFGVGYSTKYCLDNCKRVLSVEFITYGYGADRLKRFVPFYKDYTNWVPIAYFSDFPGDMTWAPYKYIGSDAVYRACSYHCVNLNHYKEVDDLYLKELNEFLTNLSKYNKIEVAVVHPILYLRGDLVQLLFEKVPIIVALNTCSRKEGKENSYGYVRVKAPENYEEIYCPLKLNTGHVTGTTVWIAKKPEYQSLIESLRQIE